MVIVVSTKCCPVYSKKKEIYLFNKLRGYLSLIELPAAFFFFFGCMLAWWSSVVSDSSAVAVYSHLLSPPPILSSIGARVSRAGEHVVNPSSQRLQLAPGHGSWCPCPALVSPCCLCGETDKRTGLLK